MRSLAEHLATPFLADPPDDGGTVQGCAGGSCGVVARFFVDVADDGTIAHCTARVRGRASALATASALSEAAVGLTPLQAAGLGLGSLHPDFAAMPEEDAERARVVEDAFHHAIGCWFIARMRAGDHARGVAAAAAPAAVVAMSGGVDSAVALHEMHGRCAGAVAGVTLRLWIDPKAPDPEAACCSPDSVRRARETCHQLGVPHVSLDLRELFTREVVAPFIALYRSGETPNPCVGCNGSFRLDELVRFADAAGSPTVATGHYVRSVRRGGTVLVQRGVDARKDQSYMLSTLAPGTLVRFSFPLGDRTKPQVRERAAALGLVQATVPESQEVCFLGGGDYRAFLGRMNALGPAGEIVTTDGEVLGEHDGIARFTPGQRRGLSVTRAPRAGQSSAPLYVVGTDPQTGTVTVGERGELLTTTVWLRNARAYLADVREATVQLRYRTTAEGALARVSWLDGGRAVLTFDEPVTAPAPGQAACLYDGDGVIVGVGTIMRTPAAVDAAGS